MHTGINYFDLSGIIKLYSEAVLEQTNLTLHGSGMIGGEIRVSVQDLQIGLSGISNLTVSGKTDNAEFNVDGMGEIDAKDLSVLKKSHKKANSFAKVRIAND